MSEVEMGEALEMGADAFEEAQEVGREWKLRAERAELALQAVVDSWPRRHEPLGEAKLEFTMEAVRRHLEQQS